ncbi:MULTISPECIES: glycosyltransferase [unclassified Halomonas]|uniref:glycosyltransferase n=1 Tax=unclassified Halomonas TaxID=2609666 RepID=UPI0007D8EDCA|nr:MULTISPECIES: glycosyltransferase [unclassified Halomonas]MBT2787312.1 glycosyltransferase [Halomonas sp. ISL-106]MBT2796324.1 glycosyltransferase [Halomonas sp. ISL-104]OAL57526.1 hypothetical protein A6R74_12185 [Halomonas sp. ALS9]
MTKTSLSPNQSEQEAGAGEGGQTQDTSSVNGKAPKGILLSVEYYRNAYPDLASLSDETLLNHWLNHGYSEGRYGSEAHKAEHVNGLKLDIDFYRQQYPDVAELDDEHLLRHWYTQGYLEGRHANKAHQAEREQGFILDTAFYRAAYPDVAELTDQDALKHWYLHGYKEGRSASQAHHAELHQGIELDIDYYRHNYSDMAALEESQVQRHWYRHGYIEGRCASPAHAELIAHGLELDVDFYRDTYEDVATLSDIGARQHWFRQGFAEGRFVSEAHRVLSIQDQAEDEEPERVYEVDLDLYLLLYPDLASNGIETLDQAEDHFQNHGKREDRVANLQQWATKQKIPANAIPEDFSLQAIQQRSEKRGVELEYNDILKLLLGKKAARAMLCETEEDTYRAYCQLAQHYVASDKHEAARQLLFSALAFQKGGKAFQLLGDNYLREAHYSTALAYYQQAVHYSDASHWAYASMATCLAALQRDEEALALIHQAITAEPKLTQQHDKLDDIVESYWNGIQGKLMACIDAGERERLIKLTNEYAYKLYNAYYSAYSDADIINDIEENSLAPLPELGSINQQKILIVGDFNVPQCVRYRIDQKVEQLEKAGKTVTTLDWQDIALKFNTIALHDIVIFYRVPALPRVIKAIAQVNAAGKQSFYEIDDLLFEPIYPPAIDSYGGYVSLETYRGLTHGMALFNSAARLCRYGIASSEPLREKLAALVQSKQCLLHRNGLDHLNQFRPQTSRDKATIDIFYGSGTQAHNSDFMEIALPALERVLEEQPKARLVIVGYLRLPKAFCKRFANQLAQLPPVKSVQGYWSLLEQADINIAVLQNDVINSCKSELKWFEAACFGIPSIVSGTANYRDVINHGEDAYIADTEEEWYAALNELIGSVDQRQRIGQAAMQRVEKEYSLSALGTQLVTQLEALLPSTSLVKSESQNVLPSVKRKKVALVNVFFPPQAVGGATRVVADNFSALQAHHSDDIELCVFTGDADCRTPHELSVYQYKGVRVYRATTLWRVDMDWHPKDEEMYRLFSEFLALEQPDIIHFHCVQRLTASVLEAARDAGVPYIVTAHDAWWISDFQFLVDHNERVYPEGHPDPFAPIALPPTISLADSVARRRDLKDLLHHAKQVLTVSNAFAEIYRKNGVPQIEVTPNGISDDMPWSPKDTSYTPNVVCGHVGGMATHKGYYLLKQAVMEAQPENLEFIVVDHSKEEGYCVKRNWGRVPITFIGRVSQDQVVELYRKMDVLFAPSLWPESFGLVTREAAACGCWVVASNLGGIGEDVVEGESGYVITPDINAILTVLSNIDLNKSRYKEPVNQIVSVMALEQTNELMSKYND